MDYEQTLAAILPFIGRDCCGFVTARENGQDVPLSIVCGVLQNAAASDLVVGTSGQYVNGDGLAFVFIGPPQDRLTEPVCGSVWIRQDDFVMGWGSEESVSWIRRDPGIKVDIRPLADSPLRPDWPDE